MLCLISVTCVLACVSMHNILFKGKTLKATPLIKGVSYKGSGHAFQFKFQLMMSTFKKRNMLALIFSLTTCNQRFSCIICKFENAGD